MSPIPRAVLLPARAAALLLAILIVAAAMVSLQGSASAQPTSTATLTFRELDKGSRFVHIRNTKTKFEQSNQQGDLIVFTNPLVDAAGKRLGALHASCTTTLGARNFEKSTMTCQGVLSLADGTLTLQVVTSPGIPTTTGAVTGGTGAYANARGVFVSADTDAGANDTITLVAP